MAVNPNLDGAVSDILERIERAERIGSVPFSVMDLRAVLASLLALREIRDNATGDARKTFDDVMQRAGDQARYATHDAKRGHESSNEHYDPLRDAWWNPQTGKWESSLERNRKRYSGNSAKQPPPGYDTDDIMDKLRRAKEKMEQREYESIFGADFAAGAEAARARERERREKAQRSAYEDLYRRARDSFRQQGGEYTYYGQYDPPPPPRDPKKRAWHEVLGVRETATNQEITKAYRRLAMKHHTDRGGKHEAIVEINVAWAEVRKVRGM